MTAITDIVLNLVEAQTQGSTTNLRKAIVFEVVSEFCREVLQIAPPTDFMSDIAGWMPDAQWVENHTYIISGVLARMYVMPGKPWTDATGATAHATVYQLGIDRGRGIYAAMQTNNVGYQRIMQNIRTLVPAIRDPLIHLELFNTVDELRRNVLQLAPANYTANPDAWMSSDEYMKYFRLILAGTLFRIYAQSARPWSDMKAAALQQSTWTEELGVVRSDAGDDAIVNPAERIVQTLRAQFPGMKDAVIYNELFNVIDEACREWFLWVETVPYKLTENRQTIKITPPGTDIVKVSDVHHEKLTEYPQYDPIEGVLNFGDDVTADVVAYPVFVTMALAPDVVVATNDPKTWIPKDLWGRLHQLLLEGTLKRLMLQPGKSWSNPKLAVVHGQSHRRLLIQARQTLQQAGIIPPRQDWQFPRFA